MTSEDRNTLPMVSVVTREPQSRGTNIGDEQDFSNVAISAPGEDEEDVEGPELIGLGPLVNRKQHSFRHLLLHFFCCFSAFCPTHHHQAADPSLRGSLSLHRMRGGEEVHDTRGFGGDALLGKRDLKLLHEVPVREREKTGHHSHGSGNDGKRGQE